MKLFNKLKKQLLIATFIVTVVKFSFAQNAQLPPPPTPVGNGLVSYSGLFRFNYTGNTLSGNRLNGDTTSARKGNAGYALFDLGININPFKDFKVGAIIRTETQIGQFFQASNIINFRQLRIEGRIAKVVKYQIGDIDLGMTQYTLYNPDETYNDYESEIFKMRRAIVSYENFNYGNKWRLQGGQAETSIKFNKVFERLNIGALATRIRKANIALSQPDRFIIGANAKLIQGRWGEVGGNWVNVFDNVGTTLDSNFNYNNNVVTGEFKFHAVDNDNIKLSAGGEFGSSNYKYTILNNTVSKQDYFFDLGLTALHKPSNFKFNASYRNIGPNFTSPSAQTIRVFNTGTSAIFGQQDIAGPRAQTAFDRLSDPTLYNQTILTSLLPYMPIYGNVTPYGPATPNRTGLTLAASISDTSGIISADAKVEVLQEILGEGVTDLRHFTSIKGGFKLGIGRLAKIDRDIYLTFGIRNENTNRGGVAPVSYQSNLIDLGLQAETFRHFDILLGAKFLHGQGNELIAKRDVFNNITSYYNYNSQAGTNAELLTENFFVINNQNQNQTILSGGVRYRFFKYSSASINYNLISVSNATVNSPADANYSFSQLFLNLTFIF